MFNEILFLSLAQMKQFKPNHDTVVVSILDNSEASQRPRLSGYRGVLTMEFEDTYEEVKYAEPGDWPDEPTPEEHARYAQGRHEMVPTLSHAKEIVTFLHKWQSSPDSLLLVAHCYGGISRSSAVAVWASNRFRVPIGSMMSTEGANQRLYRLMDKADNRY